MDAGQVVDHPLVQEWTADLDAGKLKPRAVLFVDIDGVFHAEDSRTFEYDGALVVDEARPDLFQWAPILWDIFIPHPEVIVVVHSSLRLFCSAEEIIARFPSELRPRIAGVTAGRDRNLSILAYMRDHAIDRFAVLDDRADNYPADWPPLIVCDPQHGISSPAVQDKLRHFVATR